MSYLPCGIYEQSYQADQRWWRTPFIKGKMIVYGDPVDHFSFYCG